jgi:hypothetical protein
MPASSLATCLATSLSTSDTSSSLLLMSLPWPSLCLLLRGLLALLPLPARGCMHAPKMPLQNKSSTDLF